MFLEHESRLERAWLRVFQDFARNGFYSFSFMGRMATFGDFWGELWKTDIQAPKIKAQFIDGFPIKPSMILHVSMYRVFSIATFD